MMIVLFILYLNLNKKRSEDATKYYNKIEGFKDFLEKEKLIIFILIFIGIRITFRRKSKLFLLYTSSICLCIWNIK